MSELSSRPVRADVEGASSSAGVDQVVSAVLTASRVLVGVTARSLAEVEDTVTVTQFRTLVVLDRRRRTNLGGLAETLGVNSSTAMRTVDRLIEGGLVTRAENTADRREVVLALTRSGRRLVHQVTVRRSLEIERILAGMPERRRTQLVAAFAAFAEAAGEPPPDPAALGW